MVRRITVPVCLVILCLGLLSCQRLPANVSQPAQLKTDVLPALDAIPADYGNLVAVTVDSGYPNWAQLWFEKPDKTIAVVRVNWADGSIQKNVTIIPRR